MHTDWFMKCNTAGHLTVELFMRYNMWTLNSFPKTTWQITINFSQGSGRPCWLKVDSM